MIEKALGTTNDNKTETSKLLGITLDSLIYRLAKHRMEDKDGEDEEVLEEANEL